MNIKFRFLIVLTGIIIGAMTYWPTVYEELNLFDTYFWLVTGALSFVSSFVYRLILKEIPLKIGILVALGVVLAVILRIIYDSIVLDSSAHNLAPLEIGFAVIQSLPLAFLGAYLAKGLKKQK